MDVTTILNIVLSLLTLSQGLTDSKKINAIITTLQSILPAIIKSYGDLKPIVQNIIATLQQSSAVTPAQRAALKAMDAQCDQAFDDAWAAYQANHSSPSQVTASPATANTGG